MNMKVAFYTLGCKVNQYETDSMKAIFLENGFIVVNFDEFADIYVINTCTVTSMGDKKSRQIIHNARANNDKGIVVVTGCMAQNVLKEGKTIDGADIIIGNEDRKNIISIIEKFTGKSSITEVSDISKEKTFWETKGVVSEDRTRAFIKIQDGCNRYCSYCIIPYVRGPIRSRNPEEVINEAIKMRNSGFSEIVIIGIHLASYGKDLENISLIEILEELNNIEGIKRIRLGSLEPSFITEDTVERIKKLEKVCKHFHLSLQSGSNSVLRRMNRKYTTEEYEEKVFLIRNAFPDAAITTDIITGFPGETEEEFRETYNYIKKVKFSKVHVFPYSERVGTPASKMPDQVNRRLRKDRANEIIRLSEKLENEFAESFVGKEMKIIIEEGGMEGYNEQYVKVFVPKSERGSEVTVRGENVKNGGVIGAYVNYFN